MTKGVWLILLTVTMLDDLMNELQLTVYFLRGSSSQTLSTYLVKYDGQNLNLLGIYL